MTGTTTQVPPISGSLPTEQLREFFDRLAAGDYHTLAKELRISGKPTYRPTTLPDDSFRAADADTSAASSQDPNDSIQSIDSIDSFKFQPTAEGLHRAMSLIRGDEPGRDGAMTPEEDEAFQFTFRLMIHKLYSIADFKKMVDDVVAASRDNYQPLSTDEDFGRTRRPSIAFSFSSGPSDGESFVDLSGSPTSPSETSSVFPSSDSSWTLDRMSSPPWEDESDARAVKKRIVGRKLSVVEGAADAENARLSWVYNSTVASVDSTMASFEPDVLVPLSGSSPSRNRFLGAAEEMEPSTRKRRISVLSARNV